MIRALFALMILPVFGLASGGPPEITILLQFDGKPSPKAVSEMEREMERILKDSGIRFTWRLREDVEVGQTFPDVVLVRFRGRCSMDSFPVLFDEMGSYAETYTVDGQVLPFTDVRCDKVRVSLRSAMTGRDYERGDFVMGRALGRVLAHEIYHIVAQTGVHGDDGVAQRALSGAELLSDHLAMDPADIRKLVKARFGAAFQPSTASGAPSGR